MRELLYSDLVVFYPGAQEDLVCNVLCTVLYCTVLHVNQSRCYVSIGPGVKKGPATAFFNSFDTFLNYESIFIHLPCVNFDVK